LIVGCAVVYVSAYTQVLCGLVINVASTALFILATAVLWFAVWKRGRAIRKYRAFVLHHAGALLDLDESTLSDDVVIGRQHEYDIISLELRARPADPQMVTGESGSGKTTFLVGLARQLASRGAVPVLVAMRGERADADLASLAYTTFLRAIDPHVDSVADADRIWRHLRRRRDLVVLADGLDEITSRGVPAEREEAMRLFLRHPGARGMPTLITARSYAVPSDTRISIHALEPLPTQTAIGFVAARSGRAVSQASASQLNEAGITDNPFYLRVAAALNALGVLEDIRAPERPEIRRRMLDAYLEAVVDCRLVPEVALLTDQRAIAVDRLSLIASTAPSSNSASKTS
jgi:hypothetical protein